MSLIINTLVARYMNLIMLTIKQKYQYQQVLIIHIMSGPCDNELHDENLNDTYTACDFINDHLDVCVGRSIINFRIVYFCLLQKNLLAAIPLGMLLITFLFYLIGNTAEQYLTPALSKLSQFLRFTEHLAGLTFLALGNGFADFITSVAVIGLGKPGIYMAASTLVGGSVLNGFLISPMVVMLSKRPVRLRANKFGRDLFLLMSSQAVLFVYLLNGDIHWHFSLAFPILYIIYVGTCVYQERAKTAKKAINESNQHRLSTEFEKEYAAACTEAEARGVEVVRKERESFVRYSTINLSTLIESYVGSPPPSPELRQRVFKVSGNLARSIKNRLWMNNTKRKVRVVEAAHRAMTGLEYVLHHAVSVPCTFIRNITIPPCDEEDWSRLRASVFPLPAFFVICLFFELFPHTFFADITFIIIAFCCLVLSLIIYCTTSVSRPPAILPFFTFMSFVMSAVWLWGFAKLVIDVLEVVGIAADLPLEFLAITFLSLGNGMSFLTTAVSLARMGYSEMALTGCVSVSLFSILLSFGFAALRSALLHDGSVYFDLSKYKQGVLPLIGLMVCVLGRLPFFIINCKNGFHMGKPLAYIQLVMYFSFFVAVFVLAAIVPEGDGIRF
eukprot:TRINITY_DN105852_c2_g1_i1.p1 TRINITY_DN105852_c2_g1~~TRINITY_DN105852_c2_g1_i1.p1  ORF type:complete len:614 (+),score=8.66 TRINITY_DN105852_c2_g1_i1:158-1999(+)